MWKLRIVVALVVSLAASVTVLLPASSALEKPRTFSLLEIDRSFMPLGDFEFDRVPVGGDQFAEANALYRWTGPKSKGARVGSNRILVTFVTGFGANFSHRAVLFVNAQLYLPDGTLALEGFAALPPRGAHRFTLPVVGGTGVYANARGSVSVKDVGDGTTGRTRIDLVLLP